MKKTLLAVALLSLSATALADGWKFAPRMSDPGFKFEPSVAVTAGSVKPQDGSSAEAFGLELNFNCGMLQSPDNRIRTHLSLTRVNESDHDAVSIELSPRYTVPLASGFSVGIGPSLGAVRVDPAGAGRETLFAYGLVGGLNYRAGAFYAGLDLGARRTSEKGGIDYDSRYALLKVGINF